jgi:hypothetical protein
MIKMGKMSDDMIWGKTVGVEKYNLLGKGGRGMGA